MKYINCQNTYINLILELVKITIQLQNIPTIYLVFNRVFAYKDTITLQNIAYFTKLVQKFCTTFSIQTTEPHETLWYILLSSALSYFYLVYIPKHSRISRQNKQCIFNCTDNQHTVSCSIIDVYQAQKLKPNHYEITLLKLLCTVPHSTKLCFKITGCVELSEVNTTPCTPGIFRAAPLVAFCRSFPNLINTANIEGKNKTKQKEKPVKLSAEKEET